MGLADFIENDPEPILAEWLALETREGDASDCQ
jgi:hypothetical protein